MCRGGCIDRCALMDRIKQDSNPPPHPPLKNCGVSSGLQRKAGAGASGAFGGGQGRMAAFGGATGGCQRMAAYFALVRTEHGAFIAKIRAKHGGFRVRRAKAHGSVFRVGADGTWRLYRQNPRKTRRISGAASQGAWRRISRWRGRNMAPLSPKSVQNMANSGRGVREIPSGRLQNPSSTKFFSFKA